MIHNTHRKWQREEGGPLVEAKGRHPWYGRACWHKGYRVAALQRHPICEVCKRNAATCVDHIKDFIAEDGTVSWALFSDPANHRSLCEECHNRTTPMFDGGFGNKRKAGKESYTLPTGAGGKQFASSSVSVQQLNAALPQTKAEIDELLSNIPE